MRNTVILGWAVSVAALIAMAVGHLGVHRLNWRSVQISTYAAIAPNDNLVTASMLLSVAGLAVIAILVSKYRLVGSNALAHLVPLPVGSAISGLLVLAYFEETERTVSALKRAGFWAIRQQSFHDAGLLVFFYSTILAITTLGALIALRNGNLLDRIAGCVILCLGPGSFLLMTTSWPSILGIAGGAGLQQRAALLCLWLAMAGVLAVATRASFRRVVRDT